LVQTSGVNWRSLVQRRRPPTARDGKSRIAAGGVRRGVSRRTVDDLVRRRFGIRLELEMEMAGWKGVLLRNAVDNLLEARNITLDDEKRRGAALRRAAVALYRRTGGRAALINGTDAPRRKRQSVEHWSCRKWSTMSSRVPTGRAGLPQANMRSTPTTACRRPDRLRAITRSPAIRNIRIREFRNRFEEAVRCL